MQSPELFDSLYDRYFSRVFAYFSVCFGSDTAEDLAQTVFLKLWHFLRRPGRVLPDNFKAFIFRVAVNVKNDYLRQKQRSPLSVEYDEERKTQVVELEPGMLDSMSVELALSRLRTEERDVLLLKNAGLNSGEIAKIYGISSSAVRSRLSAARAHFQKILVQYGVKCDA